MLLFWFAISILAGPVETERRFGELALLQLFFEFNRDINITHLFTPHSA
jgi:hypothetical protein